MLVKSIRVRNQAKAVIKGRWTELSGFEEKGEERIYKIHCVNLCEGSLVKNNERK